MKLSDNPQNFIAKIGLLFAASWIIVLPILYSGIPNGNDLPQHYQFAQTIYDTLQNKGFYPSWAHASNSGYGDIGIRFYPPFAYYVLAAFRAIAGDWFQASVLTFFFWFFLSAVGIFLWARENFSENASLAAAVVYLFVPYHVNQIYNAFMYAEFAASSILPFCFFFVTRICRNGKLTDVFGLSIAYALLALTHLPMIVIGSIGLLIYSLAFLKKEKIFAQLFKLSISIFTGLLASSFYWVKIARELNFVKHATEEFTNQAYDFHSNFIVSFFYVSLEDNNSRSLWFGDLMLVATFAFFVPCMFVFYRKLKNEREKMSPVLILLIAALFFATPLSLFVWENFSLLQKIQFPWRWLAIISMCGSILVAAGFEKSIEMFKSKERPIALLIGGLVLAGLTFTFTQVIKPANYIQKNEFNQLVMNLPEAESYECWWPLWANRQALKIKEKVVVHNRQAQIELWQPSEKIINFSPGEAQNGRVGVFYYPHWQAESNGESIAVEKGTDGAILLRLPSENLRVRLRFQEPPAILLANIVSIIIWAFFALCMLGVFCLKLKQRFSLKERLAVF